MVIQFSVLIVLHSCLVLVTTAEDYKCLPLVLRKACCWINETYAARNVIVFVSILINFLAAMINIVSSLSTIVALEQNLCKVDIFCLCHDSANICEDTNTNLAQQKLEFSDFASFLISKFLCRIVSLHTL